jgi:hypothetical protein
MEGPQKEIKPLLHQTITATVTASATAIALQPPP